MKTNHSQSITAIFFDIGGTLRLTQYSKGRDLEKIQDILNFLGETEDPEEFVIKIQKRVKTYRRWAKPGYLEISEGELWTRFLLPEYPEAFVRENAVMLNQLWRDSWPKEVLPDMAATLQELSRRGYKLGLISNTTSSVEGYQMLEEAGITDLFSCVLLSAEFGRRKPHPGIFIEAARRAGVLPDECAYVGDRPSRDLIGARLSAYAEVVIINAEGYFRDDYDPDDYDPEKDTHLTLRPDYWIKRLTQLLEIFPPLKSEDTQKPRGSSAYKLYDVALSTMWHVDQAAPFNTTFDTARSLGISRFELNHQVTPQLLDELGKNRNYIITVHDPCPAPDGLNILKKNDVLVSSLDESKRRQAVDMAIRTLDLAVSLGSRSLVLHTGSIQCDRSRDRQLRKWFEEGRSGTDEFIRLRDEMVVHRAQYAASHLEAVMKSLMEIIDFSRDSGVKIGVENRYRYYDLPLPDEMQELINLCDEPWFGFQLDTGHAYALETLGVCEKDVWLTCFSNRIIGVHLHDVIGLMDHNVPGKGAVDFATIGRRLPDNCLKTLEISPTATPEEIAGCLDVLEQKGCVVSFQA